MTKIEKDQYAKAIAAKHGYMDEIERALGLPENGPHLNDRELLELIRQRCAK